MTDTVIQPRPAVHPLAGQRMTGARMIMQALADEGVRAIFGYSGGAILPTYDAVFLYNEEASRAGSAQIPLIVPANEQGAGFMAAGYARASGQVGVCLVTSGPGATNTVTPVRDCMADSIPIVVICGQVARAAIGTDAFQEAPVPTMMGAVAKHIFLVTDPTRLERTVRTVDSSFSGSVTRKMCLATAPMTEGIGASWKASVPMEGRATCPQITTIGIESAMQSRTGVTVLVAPGPDVTRHTPTLPLARA